MDFLRKLKGKIGGFLRRKGSKTYFWKLRQKCKTCRFYPLRRYYIGQYQRLMARNSADIALGCDFAEVPTFPHGFYGIFISEGAKIGKNCVIFHQVTIGSNTIPGSAGRGCPTLGDHVYIGCGAKIIGNVRIGNNVRIGANCVVTRDVPDNATVVLQAPRMIVKDTPQNNAFVSYSQMVQELENS